MADKFSRPAQKYNLIVRFMVSELACAYPGMQEIVVDASAKYVPPAGNTLKKNV